MTWIKTEDQIPKQGQKVIYYFEFTGVHRGEFMILPFNDIGELHCFRSSQGLGWLCDDVTHWMPDRESDLPNPPEDNA